MYLFNYFKLHVRYVFEYIIVQETEIGNPIIYDALMLYTHRKKLTFYLIKHYITLLKSTWSPSKILHNMLFINVHSL